MRSLVVGVAGLALATSGALLAVPASAAPQDVTPRVEGSAVTKSGSGEFKDLEVTVSQTTNLVNQVVRVSWKGGKPTKPDFGLVGINYVQIMQCWGGTAEDGPPREQCVYGSQKAGGGGQNTNSRQMSTAGLVDPLEDKYDEYLDGDLSYVPFVSWTGKTTTGNRSEFFDRYTSNESNHNRTRADGTGEDFFEVQTGVESPGLGCGQSRAGETPVCWLVVVPRGDEEVDGTKRGLTYTEGSTPHRCWHRTGRIASSSRWNSSLWELHARLPAPKRRSWALTVSSRPLLAGNPRGAPGIWATSATPCSLTSRPGKSSRPSSRV